MDIGIFAPLVNPHHTPDYVLTLGREAERLGFHSIWLGEHVVLFDDYASRYPYAEDGRIPGRPDSGMLEPFTTIGYLAAATSTIRLGTGICLVPQRNPVYTAKEVSSLDYLSGGRIDFGVGIGWLREEFAALQVPWPRRAQRTREYLEVMRRLWCDTESAFEGEFYRLPPCRQNPKPVQQPHPPVHFGGESEPALQRAADIGQGWHGFNLDPGAAAERIARLRDLLAANGRAPGEVTVTVCPYSHAADLEAVKRYRAAGCDQVTLMFAVRGAADLPPLLERLAEEVLEPARAL